MRVSVEIYFLTNVLMDALLLTAVARGLGHVHPGRVLLAALLGGLYAVLAALPQLNALRLLPVQAAAALVLTRAAMPPGRSGGQILPAGLLLAAAVFLGGALQLWGPDRGLSPAASLLLGGTTGGIALCALLTRRAKRLVTWEVMVCAANDRGSVRFTALVDTGNRLREPLSGLPVLIAEEALLRPLLPRDFDAVGAARRVPSGFRAVGFGALGSTGRLVCFRPEALSIGTGHGFQRAPDAWIAVYPGRMNGSVRALAPPSFGLAGAK